MSWPRGSTRRAAPGRSPTSVCGTRDTAIFVGARSARCDNSSRLYPKLLEDASPRPPAATVGTSLEQLDIGAVVKASQAVSGEIVLDRLIETLMTLALEHAGAERGLLILLRGDVPQIAAEATHRSQDGRGHAPAGDGDDRTSCRKPCCAPCCGRGRA